MKEIESHFFFEVHRCYFLVFLFGKIRQVEFQESALKELKSSRECRKQMIKGMLCVRMSEKRPGVCRSMWWLRRCLFKICVCWSSQEDHRVGMRDLHILTKEPESEGHEAGVVLSWYKQTETKNWEVKNVITKILFPFQLPELWTFNPKSSPVFYYIS